MSEHGARLLEEALALPPAERAEMAERLWSSLDPPVDEAIAASQLQEVEERLDAYERGEVGAVPADKAIEMALKAAKKRTR